MSNLSMATVSNNSRKSFTLLEDMELRLLPGKSSINSSKEKLIEEEFFDCSNEIYSQKSIFITNSIKDT